jgi:hypothetical protein
LGISVSFTFWEEIQWICIAEFWKFKKIDNETLLMILAFMETVDNFFYHWGKLPSSQNQVIVQITNFLIVYNPYDKISKLRNVTYYFLCCPYYPDPLRPASYKDQLLVQKGNIEAKEQKIV